MITLDAFKIEHQQKNQMEYDENEKQIKKNIKKKRPIKRNIIIIEFFFSIIFLIKIIPFLLYS
jgi:hypothetical protein